MLEIAGGIVLAYGVLVVLSICAPLLLFGALWLFCFPFLAFDWLFGKKKPFTLPQK